MEGSDTRIRRYTKRVGDRSDVRIRTYFETLRGSVVTFLVKLEYNDGDAWRTVAHFDHNPFGDDGHDVTVEGLHLDIYHADGEVVKRDDFGEVSRGQWIAFCETFFEARYVSLLDDAGYGSTETDHE